MSHLAESPSSRRLKPAPVPVELDLELPPEVSAAAFAIDDIDAVLAALDGGETANELPQTFAKKRRGEYLAGRHAAAHALRRLGLPTRVERGPNGLPVWPAGALGSIAHGAGVACALCVRAGDWLSIGVDVERVFRENEARELAPAIAHQDELLLLRTALPNARTGQRLAVLFSAKESFFKSLYPLTGTFLEFCDARLVSVGMTSTERGVLAIRLERDGSPVLPRGRTLQARFSLNARRVETAVLLGKE